MKDMKRLIFASSIILISTFSYAQQVTEEHLWKYALMTEVIDQMKGDLSATVNDLIKKQEGMTSQRYKELAGGSEPASDFEKQFIETVNGVKEKRLKAIKSVNSDLATKMLGGAAVYKAVKAAAGGEMKEKYEAYREQIAFKDNS